MLITLVCIHNFAKAKNTFLHMDKNPILLQFGKNVKEYRRAQQMSQEQLAESAGVHRTYIGMIERAEKNITLLNIAKIANALKISPSVLLKNL